MESKIHDWISMPRLHTYVLVLTYAVQSGYIFYHMNFVCQAKIFGGDKFATKYAYFIEGHAF